MNRIANYFRTGWQILRRPVEMAYECQVTPKLDRIDYALLLGFYSLVGFAGQLAKAHHEAQRLDGAMVVAALLGAAASAAMLYYLVPWFYHILLREFHRNLSQEEARYYYFVASLPGITLIGMVLLGGGIVASLLAAAAKLSGILAGLVILPSIAVGAAIFGASIWCIVSSFRFAKHYLAISGWAVLGLWILMGILNAIYQAIVDQVLALLVG